MSAEGTGSLLHAALGDHLLAAGLVCAVVGYLAALYLLLKAGR
jgi:hypothetical protein